MNWEYAHGQLLRAIDAVIVWALEYARKHNRRGQIVWALTQGIPIELSKDVKMWMSILEEIEKQLDNDGRSNI